MKRRSFIGVALVIVAVAAYFGIRSYTAVMPGALGHEPVVTLNAEDLYRAFEEDEVQAGIKYNDKLLLVEGVVNQVATSEEGRMSVLLTTNSDLGSVVCEFADQAEHPVEGRRVAIKGYCAGFNFDVLLQRCAFAETSTKRPLD